MEFEILNDEHIKVVWYKPKSTDVFPNVDIKGGVAVTYRDASKKFGKIGIYSAHEELNAIMYRVLPKSESYLSDWVYSPESYKLSDIIHNENPWVRDRLSDGHDYDITTNIFEKIPELFYDTCPDDTYIGLYGRINNERTIKWIKRSYICPHDNLDKFKIFVPKANGSGALGEVLTTPVIGLPVIGHTQTYISIGALSTEFEAQSLLKYVKTKFLRTLLGILKVTQDNKKSVWRFVPLQDFTPQSDIDWSQSIPDIDRQLYAKYGLEPQEISFIESMIKPME